MSAADDVTTTTTYSVEYQRPIGTALVQKWEGWCSWAPPFATIDHARDVLADGVKQYGHYRWRLIEVTTTRRELKA